MNAHDQSNPENPSDSAAAPSNGAAEAGATPDGAAQAPAHPAETLGAAQAASRDGESAPKVEPPRLHLIPYLASPQAERAAVHPVRMTRWVSGLAAGLALIAAVTAVGLYDHARQSNIIAAKAEESLSLAQTVKTLKDRIDAIETARTREESADLRKIAAEIKAESNAAHDLNGVLAQLTARVDRIDHDQSARLDKLADRIDHDSSARTADLGARIDKVDARIDKLEKRPPAAVVAAVTPPPAPPAPTPAPKPAASPVGPKPDVVVSNETTGSIDKPRPALRGYWVVEVQGDTALIDGRDGPQQVGPGDFLPGAGRVLRIERHGRDWTVVTSAGVIAGDQSRFCGAGRGGAAASRLARRIRTTTSTRAISQPSGALGKRVSAIWPSGISMSALVSSIRK
jgi:hypothetical protein